MKVKDAYSGPRIQDTLECLQGVVWFSLLDLKGRYWKVELREASMGLTAFVITPLGFYKCEQMPLGLMNALEIFQHLMWTCLDNLQF